MERPRPVILAALALLAVLGAYSPAFQGGFLWDDHLLIGENPRAQTLDEPSTFFTRAFWSTPFLHKKENVHTFYRPVVGLTYAIDWVRSDGEPVAFHVTNVLLHLMVVALVFAVSRQLGASGRAAAAMAAAFGLLPRLSESVAWISGRTDVLAGLFGLGALWVELRGAPTWGRRLAVAALIGVGLFAKEVTLAVGLVIVLMSALRAWRNRQTAAREALLLSPLLVALVFYVAMRRTAEDVLTPVAFNEPTLLLRVMGHYTAMALVPWLPNAQPGFIYLDEPLYVVLGLGAIAGLGAGAVWLVRSKRDVPFSLVVGAWAAISLVVVLKLVHYTIAADRFLYVPLALTAIAIAPWLDRGRSALKLGVTVALAASFVVPTFMRARLWANELQFWERTTQQGHPLNPPLWGALGDVYFERDRLEEALRLFQKAASLYPSTHDGVGLSLAVVWSRLGEDARAIAVADDLAQKDPAWRRALYDRATFRSRALDFEGARAAVAQAEAVVGQDEVLTKLRALFDESEAKVRALGPEAADDAPSRTLQWAELYETLGSTGKARVRYQHVADDPRATPEQRVKALSYLVIKGEPAAARAALERLGAEPGADAAAVDGLAAILAERLGTSP